MLWYGSEALTTRKQDTERITACEMKFARRRAGYTVWDHKRNEYILDTVDIKPVIDYEGNSKSKGSFISFVLQKVHQNKYTIIFRC